MKSITQIHLPARIVFSKEGKLLIFAENHHQMLDTEAMFASATLPILSNEQLQTLPEPKKKVIEKIDSLWYHTTLWLCYDPLERYKIPPFTTPKTRHWVNHYKKWFEFQEATLLLCAVTRTCNRMLRQRGSEFVLFGGYVWEHRMAAIQSTVDGKEDTVTQNTKDHLKALALYKAWLEDPKQGIDPRDELIWGGSLSEILFGAKEAQSADAVRNWLTKSRAWYRFAKDTKGMFYPCADETSVYRLTRTGRKKIII